MAALGEICMQVLFISTIWLWISAKHGMAAHDSGGRGETREAEVDRITSLPGQPEVRFEQYSGYVTVNEEAGRALFYWLNEAVHLPDTKPLVIWLNGGFVGPNYLNSSIISKATVPTLFLFPDNTKRFGAYMTTKPLSPGPGCSSIAYGASEEIGPFRINKAGSGLHFNKYSWNLAANLLFLESPAGVGFSYSNRSSDLRDSGDRRTAKDALQFVIRWLERFPRYKMREMYLTGESYAGHYVPQLAKEIVAYNSHATKPINLKGFMVGNAVTDTYYDNLGTVTFWWTHAMISDKTYHYLVRTCKFLGGKESSTCESLYTYAIDNEFGNIDQYSIYTPSCNTSDGAAQTRRTLHLPLRPKSQIFRRMYGYDPCTEKYAEIYYNRLDVQKALHANTTTIPYKWTACSEVLNQNWKDAEKSLLPTYRELIKAGLRIWVFSGDVDSVVPVTATRFSLSHLGLKTKVPWYPWYVKKQVGGWTEVYEGLTFATVRGAGHEVPLFKPRAALQLFRSFLGGTLLPKA